MNKGRDFYRFQDVEFRQRLIPRVIWSSKTPLKFRSQLVQTKLSDATNEQLKEMKKDLKSRQEFSGRIRTLMLVRRELRHRRPKLTKKQLRITQA